MHNLGICLQLVGDRDATLAAARRAVTLTQKFGLLPWRAGGLLLTGWATAVGAGIADAARLIDAEIENATATGVFRQYYLGLAAEVLLANGRPADGLARISTARGSTNNGTIQVILTTQENRQFDSPNWCADRRRAQSHFGF